MAMAFVPPGAVFRTVLWDRRGRPALVRGGRQFQAMLPNGLSIDVHEGVSLQLVDGPVVNVSFLGGRGSLPLGICELCRYPPCSLLKTTPASHGLCSLQNLHVCPCGEPFCPRHGKQCGDEVWRCVECAKWWSLKQSYRRLGRLALRPFFRMEDEG